MAKYRYIGPGPIEVISGGELVKPLDVREFDAEPDWGLWECIGPEPVPGTDEGGQPPSLPGASPAAVSAAPALNLTSDAPKGM